MPTHKRDLSRLSISQLATLIGSAPATVSRRLRDRGVTPIGQDGRTLFYSPPAALRALLSSGTGLDLEAERARLAKEQADEKSIQNETRRGELLERADVHSAWASIVLTIKERLLSLPAHAVSKIPGFKRSMAKPLDELVREVLTELAGERPEAKGER